MPEKHLIVPPPAGSTPCTKPCHTSYVQEETAERGGAAVMQMILGSQGVGGGLSPLPSQADLFNDAKAHKLGSEPDGLWFVDPQGLMATLALRKPAGATNVWVDHHWKTLGDANANIVFTINIYEVAPAVLCSSGTQWVAVVGYKTEASGNLVSVFLNDPRPPIAMGTGDPPDFEVSASTWSANYFQPVNNAGSHWNGDFVQIVDPQPKPQAPVLNAPERPLADGRKLIAPEQAIEFARARLEERGTSQRPLFQKALSCRTARADLVKVLTGKDQFYYLVRFQGDDGGDAAAVALDARYGYFHEAIAFPKPVPMFKTTPKDIPDLIRKASRIPISLTDARNRILQSLANPCGRGGRDTATAAIEREIIRINRDNEAIDLNFIPPFVQPIMVWKPSNQTSTSMLYPAYQVDTPGRTIYIRASDLLIFAEFLGFEWFGLGG